MEVASIKIPRDLLEEIRAEKDKRAFSGTLQDFMTELVHKGMIEAEKKPVEEKEHLVEKHPEVKDSRKPDWVKGLSVEEIQRYCYEHPGAKEEYLNWWAQSHTPKQVESMKLTLSTKWW